MIKFGTSGWRGLIGRDFTFDNVRLAAQGIADFLKSRDQSKIYQGQAVAIKESGAFVEFLPGKVGPESKVVVLGYDTRFLGREFSLAAAEVLANNGLTPLLCERDTPTPVIAHTIRARKAAGGINMTASHNPAEYQGLKFSTNNGAPAPTEATRQIERNIAQF